MIISFLILYDLDESVLNCHGLLPFLLIFSGTWIDDIPDTRGTFYLLLAPSVDLAQMCIRDRATAGAARRRYRTAPEGADTGSTEKET